MRYANTLAEFTALMWEFINWPETSINEPAFNEYCFQVWYNRRSKGYSEATVKAYAKRYERDMRRGIPEKDRNRKTSPRIES